MLKSNNFKLIFLIPSIILLMSQPLFADIGIVNGPAPGIYEAFIAGAISPKDYTKLVNAAARIKAEKGSIVYYLDSNGGDVSTSLKIGRFLRKEHAWANVDKNATCSSACVFILAGATRRIVQGAVGIHRPFEPNGNDTSYDSQKQKYSRIAKEIRNYLEEMNVQPKLYDDMMYISPENMKYLSEKELSQYGLGGNDPFSEEADAAKEAKALGISRKELAKRKSRSRSVCNTSALNDNLSAEQTQIILECYNDVINGRR